MARGITGSTATELAKSKFNFTILVEIALSGSTLRYTTHGADITWNSNTYTGSTILSLSEISETIRLEPTSTRLVLDGHNSAAITNLVNASALGAVPVTIRFIALDADFNPVSSTESVQLFSGLITNISADYNGQSDMIVVDIKAGIEILANRTAYNVKYNSYDQSRVYGHDTDTGFDYIGTHNS